MKSDYPFLGQGRIMKTETETIVLTTHLGFRQGSVSADIEPDGSVCIREWEDVGHKEFRRYFKTRANAAKKLRKDWAQELAFEAEDGEMVEAGDAHWRGEPYPLKSALDKLSGE